MVYSSLVTSSVAGALEDLLFEGVRLASEFSRKVAGPLSCPSPRAVYRPPLDRGQEDSRRNGS
jgi:hypothetical protein